MEPPMDDHAIDRFPPYKLSLLHGSPPRVMREASPDLNFVTTAHKESGRLGHVRCRPGFLGPEVRRKQEDTHSAGKLALK
jgi:hypothetical protein